MPRLSRWTRYAQSPAQVARFIYHLPRTLKLIHRLMNDKRVPFHVKLLPPAAILYVAFPLDIIKDIPFIGFVDDVLVVYFLMKTFFRLCPQEVVKEHVQRLSGKKPSP